MEDTSTRVELRPSEVPDLDALATDGDFRREAERLAPQVHRRLAGAAAVRAFYAVMKEVRSRAGWRRFGVRERDAFVDRHAAHALADAGARAELVGRIAERLRELKAAMGPGRDPD